MPTEAEFLAIQTRINDLEKRMQLVYRHLTNAGLAEAKRAIDNLESNLGL